MSCIHSIAYTEGPYQRISHWHPTDQLLLVLEGRVELRISDQTYTITQPTVVFISHLEPHAFLRTSDNYRRFVVDIVPSEASRQLSDWDRLLSPFMNRPERGSHVFAVEEYAAELNTMFQMLYTESSYSDYESGQAALLQTVLHYLFRRIPEAFPYQADQMTGIIRQLQRQLDASPQDGTSLQELADAYHLSVSHLTHSFKRTTGYSIGQYRLLCRIAHAKTLLAGTNLSVGEIGARCGFSDASNFSRYFHKEVGNSPSDFRKSIQFYHGANDPRFKD